MRHYKLTESSQKDLLKIRHFTFEHWGEDQSNLYLADLRKSLQLLSEMPQMGKNCVDDLGKNVYRFPSGKHIIYYLITPDEILIIAILHQRMVPEKHLDKRV